MNGFAVPKQSTQPTQATNPFDYRAITHFDVAPTILALVTGSELRQFGLGDNLCGPVDPDARDAREGVLKHDIASHSKAYRALW